jgi:hypothetical protein
MPEPKAAELAGANRLLLAVSVIALVLLGPSFILGYVWGYRSGRASGPQSASGPAVAASPKVAPTTATVPQKSARTEAQKPAGHTAPGQVYLQLVATAASQSAAIVEALRSSGFPAVALEVPKRPDLRRVLIGPLQEGELDRARADLRSKGFPGDSAIKRTF